MTVVVVRDADTLAQYVAAWEDLAAAAIEPNVFYEPWMLLPALRAFGSSNAFGGGPDVRVVLVFAPPNELAASPSGQPVLCGLFPLRRRRGYKGVPVRVLGLWQHLYCFLCTPLLRADCATECLQAFFDWLQTSSGAALLEMPMVTGDGPFHRLLIEHFHRSGGTALTEESATRALLRLSSEASNSSPRHGDAPILAALSGKRRKELKRQENRLAELGQLHYETLEMSADEAQARCWIEEFLQLEASGWKGRENTAFACRDADKTFLLDMAQGAFRRGRLMMLALRLDERAIAMKLNLLAGDGSGGSFAFKIAFDENYTRFSPGVLLELENIRRLHAMSETHWMDSCAIPDHGMINRLWTERRIVQTVLVGAHRRGDLVVSLIPLLRWLKRGLKPNDARSLNNEEDG